MTDRMAPESPTRSNTSPDSPASVGKPPEPWLRGSLTDVPVLARAVLHALELAEEDVDRWCAGLSDDDLNARPAGIAPVAFHLRHMVRSADRLLTYAENRQLSPEQVSALKAELAPGATKDRLFEEFHAGIESTAARIRAFSTAQFGEPRKVGKQQLPTTAGCLLIHIADHTQRHVGQAITTAKIVTAARQRNLSP